MTLDPTTEAQIRDLVAWIDALRARNAPAAEIEAVEARIRELKAGRQRHVTGEAHVDVPLPEVDGEGRVGPSEG